jgi:biopolymer transport protein ExbB
MNKMKKTLMAMSILVGTCVAPMAAYQSLGQELTNEKGEVVESDAAKPAQSGGGFYDIVFGSGVVGMLLWFALFGDGAMALYFAIDSAILIQADKLMPKKLLDGVQAAMMEGDVVKAMEVCDNNPSAMAAIVKAAFQHIEEGFEAIQEAVTSASDLEQEKIQQRLNWIAVCGNLGPSLGLLGTVQGMILTFQALASGGAGDAASLANSIGQALWTTAAGLIVSIPSVSIFYSLRNKANRLILKMTAMTMEILNGLRNVSVDPGAEGEVPAEEAQA